MFISTLLLLITPPFTHSPFARLTACVGILRELGGGGKEHRRAHWPWQSGTLAGSCISAFLLVPQPGAAKSEGGDWFEDEVDRGTFPTVSFIREISSGRRSGAEDFSSAGSWLHCMPVLGKFAFRISAQAAHGTRKGWECLLAHKLRRRKARESRLG